MRPSNRFECIFDEFVVQLDLQNHYNLPRYHHEFKFPFILPLVEQTVHSDETTSQVQLRTQRG